MIQPANVIGLVLAAGAGSRFGGGKMTALLDGRPLPAHVLRAARAAGVERAVVVLGRDAPNVGRALREDGDGDRTRSFPAPYLQAVNPAPERGLASSLRLGIAIAAAMPSAAGILVLLGDQPRVRPEVIRDVLAADTPEGALAVAPSYARDAAPNPVLLLTEGFGLAADLEGDRGLGPLLASIPGRVVRVEAEGGNPDVDTLADLVALGAR